MSKKINVRTVLKKHKLGLSENKIAQTCHMSKHSVKAVLDRLRDIEFDLGTIDNYSDDELYSMFFPTKYESENLYFKVDYDYVHNELKKLRLTLEYCGMSVKTLFQRACIPIAILLTVVDILIL